MGWVLVVPADEENLRPLSLGVGTLLWSVSSYNDEDEMLDRCDIVMGG